MWQQLVDDESWWWKWSKLRIITFEEMNEWIIELDVACHPSI